MRQVFEAMERELGIGRQDALERVIILLSAVGIVGLIWALSQ